MSTPALRVGLIGCGRIAQMIHLPALQRLEGVQLAALAEADPQRLEESRAKALHAATFSDYGQMLTSSAVDAVVICLPTGMHADAAVASFEAGKHVYIEKPLATSIADAERVIAARDASGRIGAIGLNFRFHPLYRALRDRLAEAEVGAVIGMRSVFCNSVRPLPNWKKARTTGGGVLLDLLTHHADLARFILGREVESVSAELRSVRSEHDTASVRMRMSDGVCVDTLVSMSSAEDDRIEIYGDGGKLTADRFRGGQVEYTMPKRNQSLVGRGMAAMQAVLGSPARGLRIIKPPAEVSFARALSAFAARARGVEGAEPVALEEGLRSLMIIAAAEESSQRGGAPVRLAPLPEQVRAQSPAPAPAEEVLLA
jgi:predicted dehydrogenase